MLYNIYILSPLEQFDILPIIPIFFNTFDISITNETIIMSLGILGIISLVFLIQCVDNTLPLIPKKVKFFLKLYIN